MGAKSRYWLWWLVAVLVVSWTVSISPHDASASDQLIAVNTGVAVVRGDGVRAQGSAFRVSEAQQDQDLNNDGDIDDSVLHRYHPDTGVLNLSLASAYRMWGDGVDAVVAFYVREWAQGSVDLNGDNDTDDEVMHLHHRDLGAINLSLAGDVEAPFVTSGQRVAFGVPESRQGDTDLNADGDVDFWDFVLHVYQPESGVVNVGYAVLPIALIDSGVIFGVSEYSQGTSDLNGDGDTSDYVAHALVDGVVTNLGVASDDYRVFGDFVFIDVSEAAQGGLDLNGDGDTIDDVLHVYTPSEGLINLEVVTSGPMPCADEFMFSISEWHNGSTDLNADGDSSDNVLYLYEPPSTLTNLGVAGGQPGQYDGGCAFVVDEAQQADTDLNDDGDASDQIAHTYENGVIKNLGIACRFLYSHGPIGVWRWPNSVGAGFGCNVSEEDQGNSDLNGDGDTDDRVSHIYYVSEGITNLGVGAAWTSYTVLGDGFAISVSESEEGVDLNGDGLIAGTIVHYYDRVSGVLLNQGIHGQQLSSVSSNQLIWPVAEYLNGPVDLNGDGDTDDTVVHTLTVAEANIATRLEAMQDDIAALADAGELGNRAASQLISELDRTIRYVEDEITQAACGLLNRLSTRIERLVRTGSLAAEYAGPLLGETLAIRVQLGC